MKRSHRAMLIVGLVMIAIGIFLPLLGLTGIGEGLISADATVPPSLWIAFLGLLVGIPLAAAGCLLSAVAIAAHRFRR